MNGEKSKEWAKSLREKARHGFFFLAPPALFEPLLTIAPHMPSEAKEILDNLIANLRTAANSASIPYSMANAAVADSHFERILIAERIRQCVSSSPELAKKEEEQAHRSAIEKYRTASKEWYPDEILLNLGRALANHELAFSNAELLRQTLLMIWGAFEVFSSDLIRSIVNANPLAGVHLMRADPTKKYFSQRLITIDTLLENGFNLHDKLGDVLISDYTSLSLPVIQETLVSLKVGDAGFASKIACKELWTLWQRRHVIVHRRGIVDKTYLQKTGDNCALGSTLEISPDYLDECFELIRDVALGFAAQPHPRI